MYIKKYSKICPKKYFQIVLVGSKLFLNSDYKYLKM